ncbi:ABC transporter permease [Clostridia bacterium OttesenSCG-928-O13]|nr:ABC transporter permease [Clostridia bacterium OttesenSCG-928-O13]
MLNTLSTLLASAISASAPIIFASVGETVSQRSGVMNLGLEGVMLVGAIVGYSTAVQTNSLPLAILHVVLAGALLGLLYAFLTVTLRTNQPVTGLAFVMLGTGLSGMMAKNVGSMGGFGAFAKMKIPVLGDIPLIGPMLFKQDMLVYILYILVPLATWYVYRTRGGLRLRALGENPGALDAMGLNVFALRYLYVMIGTIIVAIGGAYVTLAYTPSWAEKITAGKGWIASALVIFAGWNPTRAALGGILFGAIEVLALYIQSAGIPIPSDFLSMLPYFATVAVLILSTGNFRKKRAAMPAAIGAAYDREAR